MRNILLYEPYQLEVFRVQNATDEQIKQLDDEENYVIVDPIQMQCFVRGEWINIPEGRFQSDGQLVVVNGG